MDAFAAIEELTRKMQRVVVAPSDTAVNEKGGRESDEQVAPLRQKKRSNREMRGDRRASDGDEVEVHEHHGETMADADDGDDTTSGHDEQNAHYKDEDGEATVRASGECERTAAGKGSDVVKATEETTSSATTMAEEEESEKAATSNDTSAPTIAAAAAAAEEDEEDAEASNDRNLSALSLIQRIGNVTISSDRSSGNEEHAGSMSIAAADSNASSSTTNETSSHTDTHPGLQSPPSSRSPTSSSSSPSLFTRKRRGAFGPFGMTDGKDGSHRQSSSSNSSFKGEHSGPSTLPLFPSSKKQKLMVEVGDSFLTMVSRKSKMSIPSSGSTSPTAKTSPPSSSSPSSNNNSSKNDKCSSHGNETEPSVFTVNPHKRQRESSHNPSFDKFPILDDELSTAAHMIRLTKRRKNHQSTSVAAVDQRSSSPTS